MTWKIKDDVIFIDEKDEFEHLPRATITMVTATASLG